MITAFIQHRPLSSLCLIPFILTNVVVGGLSFLFHGNYTSDYAITGNICCLISVLSIFPVIIKYRSALECEITKSQQVHSTLAYRSSNKDKFMSVISHDLRGLLHIILGTSEIVSLRVEEMEREKLIRLLGNIHTAADNMNTLLNDLLDWDRAQSGQLPFEPQCVSMGEIITNALDSILPIAAKKQVVLTTKGNHQTEIFADSNMITSIIRHLASNATKFTQPHGSVTIDWEIINESVHFSIIDTGIGMTEELLEHLFSLQTNTQRVGTAGEQGFGLGLLLCYNFAAHHGTILKATSSIGIGSSFTMALPIRPEQIPTDWNISHKTVPPEGLV